LRRIDPQDPLAKSPSAIFIARHVLRVARFRLPQQLRRALAQAGIFSRYRRICQAEIAIIHRRFPE
jgi:hypothetical protein